MTRDTGKALLDALVESGYSCSLAVGVHDGAEHASLHIHEMRLTVSDLSAIHRIADMRSCELLLASGELRLVEKPKP